MVSLTFATMWCQSNSSCLYWLLWHFSKIQCALFEIYNSKTKSDKFEESTCVVNCLRVWQPEGRSRASAEGLWALCCTAEVQKSRWGLGGVPHDTRGPAPAATGVDLPDGWEATPNDPASCSSAFLSSAEQLMYHTVKDWVKTLSTLHQLKETRAGRSSPAALNLLRK